MSSAIYDFEINQSNGNTIKLGEYKKKVILFVNTATQCGLTPQFEGLEKLHQNYKDKGLVVLGFPCNQFANQEPETDDKMAETCKINHGVTFPLTEKIKVNGPETHPIFRHLKKEKSGFLIPKIKWNFTKFLADKNGNIVKRYAPTTEPLKIEKDIKALL